MTMQIQETTQLYENWLATQLPLLVEDLEDKHRIMKKGLFPFFRATFYRWLQRWYQECGELSNAPEVLSVGDLHIGNFGTWRDAEGRLIWGINDFDEAYPLPYPHDLVRLASSAVIAIEGELSDICEAILAGYLDNLKTGGRAWVLAESHAWLRQLAVKQLPDPVKFWKRKTQLPTWTSQVPPEVTELFSNSMPENHLPYRVARRSTGLGSLGHRRLVAIADWRGGKIAREAKELASSAGTWVKGGRAEIFYQKIIDQAIRVPDPYLKLSGTWVVRRLAPDSSDIELTELAKKRDRAKLLYAMGWETANIHQGSQMSDVQKHVKELPPKWLNSAVKNMLEVTRKDWKRWQEG